MAERYEIYKCEICGNVIEVLHGGAGQLVCCGQPMKLMEAKKEEQGYEKHLPLVEKEDGKTKVKVGSVPHPMEEGHFIEMIEVITTDGGILRKYLKPGQKPETEFDVEDVKEAREYCTIHGLWAKG
ncbi:MAG: desulfoferrodoxin [Thermoplasmata archaeon]|nr:MAG: desulfoferrodoxin [Thermoplasmata archaeon]KAA0011563.1 MAG: desulfoferrodoxin [Thermoplasmata archaeon]